jgi:hypothetical protein
MRSDTLDTTAAPRPAGVRRSACTRCSLCSPRAGINLIQTQPRTVLNVASGTIALVHGAAPLATIAGLIVIGAGYIVYRCTTGDPVPFVCPGP